MKKIKPVDALIRTGNKKVKYFTSCFLKELGVFTGAIGKTPLLTLLGWLIRLLHGPGP